MEITATRLAENFPIYTSTQRLSEVLMRCELFQQIMHSPGHIIEGGVGWGRGLMTWLHAMAIFDPRNITRRVYGFDTFDSSNRFPTLNEKDGSLPDDDGFWFSIAVNEQHLTESIAHFCHEYFANVRRADLVKGDAVQTIPQWADQHQGEIISLLYLDFDVYEPTITALKHLTPFMHKGAIIAFDECNHRRWPGETIALREHFDPLDAYGIQRFHYGNGLLSWICL